MPDNQQNSACRAHLMIRRVFYSLGVFQICQFAVPLVVQYIADATQGGMIFAIVNCFTESVVLPSAVDQYPPFATKLQFD